MNATLFMGGGDEIMGDIFNVTDAKLTILGATTAATVFSGEGILLRAVVDKAVAGAEISFADIDGTDLGINPDCDVKGTLAYGYELRNGLTCTASNGAAGLVHLFYRKWD
jgi:hypothetical protein